MRVQNHKGSTMKRYHVISISVLAGLLVGLSLSAKASETVNFSGHEAYRYHCDNGKNPINFSNGEDEILIYGGAEYLNTGIAEDDSSIFDSTIGANHTVSVKWSGNAMRFTETDHGKIVEVTMCG